MDLGMKCRHGESYDKCGTCNLQEEDIEAMTHGFVRVDFYRLANAFEVSIEEVHTAVGKVGTLYRQIA